MDKKKYISINWHTDDILDTAKNMEIKLTIREANIILDFLKHKHDASVGINWEVIEYWINDFNENRDNWIK